MEPPCEALNLVCLLVELQHLITHMILTTADYYVIGILLPYAALSA